MRLAIALAAALVAAPALAADFTTIQPGPRTVDGNALQRPFADWIDLAVSGVHRSNHNGATKCSVEGTVDQVYRGLHYRRGETAVIDVPCAKPGVSPLKLSAFGGFLVDWDWLPTVHRASIQLDDNGRVVSFADTNGLTRVY